MKLILVVIFFIELSFARELEKIYIHSNTQLSVPKLNNEVLQRFTLSSNRITNKPFYIAKYETTNEQYINYLKVSKQLQKIEFVSDELNEPVVNVNFNEAEQFCKYHQGRLPTQIEWIIASSFKLAPSSCYENIDKNKFYPFSTVSFDFKNNSEIIKCLIEQDEEFDPSLLGSELLDVEDSVENINGTFGLLGNVYEWVDTDIVYFNKEYKLIKGGSYTNSNMKILFDNRVSNFVSKNTQAQNIGFRCVWDHKE